jgi:Pentatricopeptide repeat domain
MLLCTTLSSMRVRVWGISRKLSRLCRPCRYFLPPPFPPPYPSSQLPFRRIATISAGTAPVEFTLTLLLLALSAQDEGIHPDVITYTSLLKACGINGRDGTVLLAEEIFSQMQQKTNHFSNTVEPTELTFQRLMQAHVRAPEGQVDTAR